MEGRGGDAETVEAVASVAEMSKRSTRKIDWGDEDFADTDNVVAYRHGCSLSAVLAERRRRDIKKVRTKRAAADTDLDGLIAKLEADLSALKAAREVAEKYGLAMPLHPIPRVHVARATEPEPTVHAGKGKNAPRLDVHFGDCWQAPKSLGGCKNKTPILPSGKPATVCHVHATQATRDRWKFLERKHKQPTIFPFPNVTLDALGLSESSKKYGWGKDSHGKELKPVNDRGIRRPHGRPPKSTYGKKRATSPAKKPGNISAKSAGEISPIFDPSKVETIVPTDLSPTVPAISQAKESGNISAKTTRNISPPPAPTPPQTSWTSMADVLPMHVRWLWRHRVPAGMLTVVFALPGVGKGTLTVALAAAVTTGSALPDDEQARIASDVLFVVAEDDLNVTLKPRLTAAAVDVIRVRALGRERQLVLPRDLALIEEAARGCALVVVDPLRALTNGDSRSRVREVLTTLEGMAARTGAAVIVVHHSSKGDEESPLGSQDIVGIPRSVLRVEVRGDGVRAVHQQKKNLAPDAEPAYFRIVDRGGVGAVEWEHREKPTLQPSTTPSRPLAIVPPPQPDFVDVDGRTYEEIERDVYRRALERTKGNMSKAARALHIPKSTFFDKAQQLGLVPVPEADETLVSAEPSLSHTEQVSSAQDHMSVCAPEQMSPPQAVEETLDDVDEPVIELTASPVFRPVRPPKQPVPIPDVSGMLLADKQLTWVKAAQQGNELAAKLLLDSVEKLIFKFANRTLFHARAQGILSEEDMLDVYAAVKMRLYRKIPDFDPTKAGWSTFSLNWIRAAAQVWLREHGRTVRTPAHVFEARSRVFKAETALTVSLGRAPTDEEVCAAAHTSSKTLAGVRALRHGTVALDAPLNTDSETSLLDMLATEPTKKNTLESMIEDQHIDEVKQLLAMLDPRERCVIENRFGIGDDDPLTLDQIGEKFGVCKERIRQIEVAALARLRRRAGIALSLDELRASRTQHRGSRASQEQGRLPKGVYPAHGSPGRYVARPRIDGRLIYLGTFDSVEKAEAAIAARPKNWKLDPV